MADSLEEPRTDESRIARRRTAARDGGGPAYAAKRDKLISVAAEVFREKGYEAATLHDIADRFGTDRASLYYYVAGKEELLQEAVRGILDQNAEQVERIAEMDLDAPAKLTRLMEQLLASYEANYPYMYVFLQEEHTILGDDNLWAQQMADQTRRIERNTMAIIRQGVAEGTLRDDIPVKLAANAMFGMVNWTHRWLKPGQPDSTTLASVFSTILTHGMQPQTER